MHLEHAYVALGLVVVEGDGQVVEKGEDLVLAEPQTFEEVAGGGLLDPSALAGAALGRRIGRMPRGEQRVVAGDERLADRGRERAQSSGARLLDSRPSSPAAAP